MTFRTNCIEQELQINKVQSVTMAMSVNSFIIYFQMCRKSINVTRKSSVIPLTPTVSSTSSLRSAVKLLYNTEYNLLAR